MEVFSHVLELLLGFHYHLCHQSYLVKYKWPNYFCVPFYVYHCPHSFNKKLLGRSLPAYAVLDKELNKLQLWHVTIMSSHVFWLKTFILWSSKQCRQSKSLIQHLNKSRIVTTEREMKTNINIYTLVRYKMQTKIALILTVIVNLPVISLGTWNPCDLYTSSILNFEQQLVINFWSQKALTFSSDSVSKIW